MKYKLIYYQLSILFFFTTISQSLLSQNFLDIGNQWVFEYYEALGPGAYINRKIETITITKDTFINNKVYFELVSTRAHLCDIYGISEFLREEEGKLYRLSRNAETEFLMIDFNEQVSYEITSETFGGSILSEAVIDSFGVETFPSGQQIETQYMRILNNLSYDDNTLYKVHNKIGFLNPGLLFPDIGTGLCDPSGKFILNKCFISNQDTIRFTDSDCFEFDILDSVEEFPIEQIEIYPNPATDFVTIPANLSVLRLHDMNGVEFKVKVNGNNIEIADLVNGVYFLIFEDNTSAKRLMSKFVKL